MTRGVSEVLPSMIILERVPWFPDQGFGRVLLPNEMKNGVPGTGAGDVIWLGI